VFIVVIDGYIDLEMLAERIDLGSNVKTWI
jgi:hypothetical protein